jgi:hypothetical protein
MTTDGRPLPLSLDEITPEWLTAALRTRTPDVEVRSLRVVEVIHGTTTKVRLELGLNEAGARAGIPRDVVVKGGFEEHSRVLHRMHEREVRGYRDVFSVIDLPTPTCYFADYDEVAQQGIIVMDDLVSQGVTWCHATRPQSHEQIARRLSTLARFHAATWDSDELVDGRWAELPDFFDAMDGYVHRYLDPVVWRRFCELPRGAAVSVRFHDRDWMVESWRKQRAFAATLPHCVLHGDVHLGNLYLDRAGEPGFVDTLASRGPGMLEVAYHVSASLDSADRRRSEAPLVGHYLDELARHGVTIPTFEEAMAQYGVLLLYGHFIWMTTEPQNQTETVNTANAARVSAAMLDHDLLTLYERLP